MSEVCQRTPTRWGAGSAALGRPFALARVPPRSRPRAPQFDVCGAFFASDVGEVGEAGAGAELAMGQPLSLPTPRHRDAPVLLTAAPLNAPIASPVAAPASSGPDMVYGPSNSRFTCERPGCGRPFSRRYSLERRLLRHDGVRPHACPHAGCRLAFVARGSLKRHLRAHGQEKPFQCTHPGCRRRLADRTNFPHHVAAHAGAPPFRCACGRAFPRRRDLERHGLSCPAPPPAATVTPRRRLLLLALRSSRSRSELKRKRKQCPPASCCQWRPRRSLGASSCACRRRPRWAASRCSSCPSPRCRAAREWLRARTPSERRARLRATL